MGSFLSASDEDTKRIAKNLAKSGKFRIIGLIGELGAGKTTFAQGFAQGLGIKEKIISPTFVLIRQHKLLKTKKTLYHIDLYRLEDDKEFQRLGLREILNDPENIVLIEWAEKAKSILPKETIWVLFETIEEQKHKIMIVSSL